jgi:hypothetical protein
MAAINRPSPLCRDFSIKRRGARAAGRTRKRMTCRRMAHAWHTEGRSERIAMSRRPGRAACRCRAEARQHFASSIESTDSRCSNRSGRSAGVRQVTHRSSSGPHRGATRRRLARYSLRKLRFGRWRSAIERVELRETSTRRPAPSRARDARSSCGARLTTEPDASSEPWCPSD